MRKRLMVTGCGGFVAGAIVHQAKEGWEVHALTRKAALLGCVLMLIGMCVWFIPPMTARMLFEPQVLANSSLPKPAESSYAVSAMQMLPTGMTG